MNILQSLANDAKKKKDELVNAITNTGQRPSAPAPQQPLPMRPPVPQPSLFHQATNFLNTPTSNPLVRGLQTADRLVTSPFMPVVKSAAQGYDLARAGVGAVTGNQQATHNALQANKNDYNSMLDTGRQLVTRPAAEIATSLTPRQQTYTPGSRVEKAIFGNTPVQNIQKKVINTYDSHPNLPAWQRYGLAGGELAASVAQDAPFVGGAAKGLKIGAKAAAPVIADTAKAIAAPKTFAGLPAKQVIMDTSKLDTLHNFLDHPVNSPNVAQSQDIIKGLHQIKNDHGLDFISGSHADRMQRVSQFLEQNGEAIPQYQKSVALRNKLMVSDQTGGGAVGDSPIINKLKGTRPAAELQTKLENAHNSGNTALEAKLARQLPDQAMNPNATLPAARKAELMAKMQQASTADAATPVSVSPDAAGATTKAGEPVNGTALAQDTPINVKSYIDQQHGLQEQARKAGEPQGLQKLQAGTEGLKSKLVDSLAPIEDRLNQKITAANATSHITPQLDRALRADTIAGQYMKDNGLANVIQKVPNTKEFDQYLIAKHAADLSKNGIQTGRNASADKQLVNALKDTYEPHAQALKAYSQGLLDKAASYGLISKDTAAMLKEKYPNYVPANRIFGEGELPTPPKGTGAGKASIGSQTVVQKIKGSSRQIESPLASLINKTNDVISQGERNHAAQILTGYKDLPGNPFNLRELGATEQVGNKPVISVLQDGKKVQYETDPVISNAAKSLSKEQLGLIGKILAVPTRVLRLGATGLNPAFTGANIIKDLASGAINSKNPLRSSVANPRVFVEALKAAGNHNSAQYAELVREGAGGTSFDIARNAPKENVASIRAQKNAGTKIAYTVTHPAQLFRVAENTIGRSEEFSRALQYYGGKEAALAKGASSDAARTLGAHAARNNTVNFARAGDYGRLLNTTLPYLNAGIQGSRTLIRTIGERPAQTAAKLAVVGFLPTAATTVWNLGSPDRKAAYDDIKDYEKQGNLIIVPPNPKKDANGKWNVIKIPVSQEIANLNNIVRNGVESGLKDGSLNGKQIAGDLFGTATSVQAENGRQLVGQFTPQAVKPVVESTLNKNLYTGNNIVPDSQKNLDARDQYGPGTSGTARLIGRGTNLSPRQIDNAIRTGTGGLGQNVLNVSDQALAKTGVISPQDVKGTSFQASIKNRFSGAQGSSQYDTIDNKSADLTKQLKATPGYQAMAPADKAKALSRLNNAVVSTYTSKKALTPRQQAINNGSVNVNDYLTPAAKGGVTINSKVSDPSKKVLDDYNSLSADQRKQKEHSQSDYEYKVAQAKYENDKASGKLSKAEDINAQNNLQKAAVGSKYSKDVRELYGVNKADLYTFLTTDPNGQKYADQLKSYDQALKDNGIIKTGKFKNGFNTASGSGSRGGSGGRKKSLSTLIAEFKLPGNADFKNRSKAASLARNAKLAKKRA